MPARKTAATHSSSAKNTAISNSGNNSNSHNSNMTSGNYVGANSTAFTSRDKRFSTESSSFPSAQDNANPEKPWYDDEALVTHLLEIASTLHVISVAVNDDGSANNNNNNNNSNNTVTGDMGSSRNRINDSKNAGGNNNIINNIINTSKSKENVGSYEHAKANAHSSDHTRDQIINTDAVDAAPASGAAADGIGGEVSSLSQVNAYNIDQVLSALSQDALKEKKERVCCELTFHVASALHCNDYWTNLVSQYMVDQVVELIDYCASCRYSAAKTIHLLAAWEKLKKCVEQLPAHLHHSLPNEVAKATVKASLQEETATSSLSQLPTSRESSVPSTEHSGIVEHHQVANNSTLTIDSVHNEKNTKYIIVNTDKETAAASTVTPAIAATMTKIPTLQENNTNETTITTDIDQSNNNNSSYCTSSSNVCNEEQQLLLLHLSEFMQREITEGARWRELMREKAKMDAKNAILYSSNNSNGNYNSGNAMGNRRANKGRGDGTKIGGGGNNKGVINEEMEKQQKFYELIASLPQENIYLDRKEELYEFVRLFVKEGLYQHAALFRHNRQCVAYERKYEEQDNECNNDESCNVSSNKNNNKYTLYGRDVITQRYNYIVEQPFRVHPLSRAILVTPSSQNSNNESTSSNVNSAQLVSGTSAKKDVTGSSSSKKKSVSKEKQITINTGYVEAAALEHSTHQHGADSTHAEINNTNTNKALVKQTHKSILSSNASINGEDGKTRNNSRSNSSTSSKRNSQQDSRSHEFVNTTTTTTTEPNIATEKAVASSLSTLNSSHLSQEEIEAFHSMRDEEVNRMVERYTSHVEAEAAQRAAEQRAREMTLHLSNEGTAKVVEHVYESMEDELSERQKKILQRINALEDLLGISSSATATVASRNGSGNSNDAKNTRSANKGTKNAMETKNKKSSTRPSSSSLKRE